MEAYKEKKFRSKSLNSQRVSIRRKNSFNKVRLLFENNCNSSEIRRHSDIVLKNESLEGISNHSKCDSLKVIEEKEGNYNNLDSIEPKEMYVSKNLNSVQSNHLTNDQKCVENVNDSGLVKDKIFFFEKKLNYEEIDGKKCNHTINMTQELKFCDKFSENYGNEDKKDISYEMKYDSNSDKQWKPLIAVNSIVSENCDNRVSLDNNLCTIESPNADTNYIRSLSITSVSSLTSDFVSFDGEPEVNFRKPEIKTLENFKTKPIPKQRTSTIKTNEKYGTENFMGIIETSFKSKTNTELSKRKSTQSEDSGISNTYENNSFLWQTNKSLYQIYDDKQNMCCEGDDQINLVIDEQQNEEIYEHIYEELINCRSLSSNEWIDIENEDKKEMQTIKLEVPQMPTNRRSHNFRSNNNYRKSFRPKVNKRKTNKINNSILKSSEESKDTHSGSATEYEDIEDDGDYDQTFSKSQLNKMSNKPEIPQKDHHIYELMSHKEDIELRNGSQIRDIQTKLVRELCNKLVKNEPQSNAQTIEVSNKIVVECQPNIYTLTPRRLPPFQSNFKETHNKRDSILSRNSSIYISPNYCQTNLLNNSDNDFNSTQFSIFPKSNTNAETYKKQFSITGSIASYLEFIGSEVETICSPFKSEPLYQFYQKDVRRRAELWIHFDQNLSDLEYDDFENNTIYGTNANNQSNISDNKSDDQINCDRIHSLCKRNISAMDLVGYGPNRSLWCQLPQVINSKDNVLSTLSDKEKRLQESMFEIITSEASYCKSLNILVSHFYNCIEFSKNNPQILSQREKKCLFSNIMDVSKISCNLLKDLEKRFEQNILLYDVCDVLYDYAVNHFQPYIHYCAYQRDQEKLLTQLTQSRTAFVDVLQRLESYQICQNQNLLSFLMLPMQRITRYPLLIDAVCQQLPPESPLLQSLRKALGFVNQLVRKCNEETKKVQRMQELIEIEKILHFPSKMKSYPIVSGARYLVKKGSILRLSPLLFAKKSIGKSTLKWSKSSIYLFLFSDLLIISKKKSENNYSVFDYCPRSTVQLIPLTNSRKETDNFPIPVPRNYHNLAQLILLNNHESKSVEYTISFELESEKLRWIEAMSQPSSDNPNEVIYEEWDCPQVQCIKSYCAQQTDEISLEETDVLNVFRKMKDGWFEGQRIRDGIKGWFPSNYTEEIINQHVRARNIRLRHRLLMYTQSVIEEQKKCPNN